MKRTTKIFALLLICVLLAVGTVFPAGATDYSGIPAKTVEVVFPLSGLYGVNGWLTFDNLDIFSEIQVTKRVVSGSDIAGSFNCTTATADIFKNGTAAISNTVTAFPNGGDAQLAAFLYGAQNATDFEIVLNCTVKSTAKNGDVCNISFKHENCINADGDMDETVYTDTNKVTVATDEDLIIGTQKRYSGDAREIRLVVKMTGSLQKILNQEKVTIYANIDGETTVVELKNVYESIENDGVYVHASDYGCTRFALCYLGCIKDVDDITVYATKTDTEGNVICGATKKLDLTKLRQ